MELRHLETFVEIVRQGSFWQAAETLGLAQSTVTLQIQQLERVIHVKLFERHGKRVSLTDLGRGFYEQAEELLTQSYALKTSMRDLASSESGRVRVGAIEPTAGVRLPMIMAQFCKQWPRVELTLSIGNSGTISDRVTNGDVDFGICALPQVRNGLRFDPLFTERMVLLFADQHPLNQLPRISAQDIVEHRLLLPERTCPYRNMIEATLQGETKEELHITEIGSLDALCRTAAHGIGVGIVPEILTDSFAAGTVARQIDDTEINMTIGIVQKSMDTKSDAAVQALLHMVKSELHEPNVAELAKKELLVAAAE